MTSLDRPTDLVTNAVLHGAAPAWLHVRRGADRVRPARKGRDQGEPQAVHGLAFAPGEDREIGAGVADFERR